MRRPLVLMSVGALPGLLRRGGSCLTPAAGTPLADLAALPAGTVPLLFTDLAGSTALLEAHPAACREAARRHR